MSFSFRSHIPRSADDRMISAKLASFGVATVSECYDKQGVMDPLIRPIAHGNPIAGVAVTVKCFDADNLMLHAAISICKPGDLLVVSTNTQTMNGYFGELMATSAKSIGIVGLVIDGGIRDTRALIDMEFPVWSRYICVTGTSKTNPGWVNSPIVCGGVSVLAGDFVVADDDGVVAVPRDSVGEVIEKCESRTKREDEVRERLKKGELSMNIYNLKAKMESLGVKYENEK